MTTLKNIFLLLTGLLCCNLCEAQIFVNKDSKGINNESSWENAFTSLQDAIDVAKNGNQIWVATGTYLPANSSDSKSSAFYVIKGIQIFGGFAGTESNLSERNHSKYPTILSGDLQQDDIPDDFETNRSDNVSTIMLVENKTASLPLIDGFTFTGGHAAEKVDDNE